jgi:predicted enzyme related to lactoylglutathione lyase
MNLVSIRIITDDIKNLVAFYERVTEIKATFYTEDFAELKTQCATLAIGSTRTLQFFGGEAVAQAAHNRTAVIEFMVENVAADYDRLNDLHHRVVQEPTLMPWGNQSLLLRDPDGNLVNLFTPSTPEAIRKFQGNIS